MTNNFNATEKQRRIYYQNIVYSVCNTLEKYTGKTVVCGTFDSQSLEVQEGVRDLVEKLYRLQREADAQV